MVAQGSSGPRVRVAALMLIDGKVVLARHRAGRSVYHLLPGGGVEYRETLADSLHREIAEETGLEIAVGRPLLINDTIDPAGSRHVVNITFAAEVIGGAILEEPVDARVEAIDLVAPSQLVDLDLRPPMAEQIVEALAQGEGFHTAYLGPLFTAGR